jgi:predicted dinucleotide-utilizing enzyme
VIKAGLLGCGIIARRRPRVDFVAVYDLIPGRAERIAAALNATPCRTVEELIRGDFGLMVELWVDPAVSRNRHELVVSGDLGDVRIRVDNVTSPENPATSYLAALSVITLLDGLHDPLVVGT